MNNARPKIGIGYHVGLLTVAGRTDKRVSSYMVWRCQCECGGEIELDTRCLQRGAVSDCGCMKNVKPGTSNISGNRYGKLVAVEPTEERGYGGTVIWKCQCDCGNVCYVSLHQLQAGYVKSCGCLSHPPLKDFVGKRFGHLTVLSYEEKRAGMHRWRCRCDCGKETVVGQTLLQSGKTKSCGCLVAEQVFENFGIVDGSSVTVIEHYQSHLSPNNTSGYNGVYRHKKNNKWVAQITFKKRKYYLGSYSKLEDAVEARRRGEVMHDEFLEWYYEHFPDKKLKKD